MGIHFELECKQCDYEAIVSGGADCGFNGRVHTAICKTCRPTQLVDAGLYPDAWAPVSNSAEDYRCPYARTREHDLTLWTAPGPCPRCGHTMTEKEDGARILWD